MPKVTVIMPSLNVVKYIASCMDSVLAQTLQDIEILAIDAGSDDGTFELLQKYAALDKRIKVMQSCKKSYGYQLNMGIALAQGDYVGIVETDDEIEADMFQTLYESAVKTEADYVKGCARPFIEVTPEIIVSFRDRCTSLAGVLERVINPQKYPGLFVTDRFLWLGIYRNDFIKKVKLNETFGAAFQDIGFMFQVISNADKAIYLDKDVYFYRQDNIDASSCNVRGFRYLVEEYVYVKQFLQKKEKEWHQVYYRKLLDQCVGRFLVMAESGAFWKEAVSDMEILREELRQAMESGFLLPEELDEGTRERFQLLMKGTASIYGYYVKELQNKKAIICNLLDAVKHYPVVIFGCGDIGKYVHALLEKWNSGFPMAYCDNNVELWDARIQGIMVYSPEKAVCQYPDAVYVVTGRKSAKAMQQQLRGLGVKDSRICVFREEIDMMMLRGNDYADTKID